MASHDGASRGDRAALALAALTFALTAAAGPFSPVAVHPDAALQQTATGRTLVTLKPWNGRLYAGFGDYTANTGPISIRALDPVSGSFGPVLLRQGTEAIYLYRALGGKLYAPHTDPIAGESMGGFAEGVPGAPDDAWRDRYLVTGVHFYDVATFDGSDLWLAGSRGNDAALWRSVDGGQSFVDAPLLALTPPSGFSRFYFAAPFLGRLYAQASGFRASRVWDGSLFSDGPDLLPDGGYGWHAETFGSALLYQTQHAGLGASWLMTFDGLAAQKLLTRRVYDYAVEGGTLLALTARYIPMPGSAGGGVYVPDAVVATTDLCSWTEVASSAPPQARSIALLNDVLYVGASEAELLRHDPAFVPPTAGPPAEVRLLMAVKRGPDVVLSWDALLLPPSCETYSLLRAEAPPAANRSDFQTIQNGIAALTASDPDAAAGAGFHAYLVFAESPYGPGPTGR